MNILGTQYTLNNKSFEIYVAGCNASPHCPGCHNPESWDQNLGNKYDDEIASQLTEKIILFGSMIDKIWILGGEPLDQDMNDLFDLILTLEYTKRKLWLFTRYEIDEIPEKIKNRFDVIKTGAYDERLRVENYTVNNVTLATSNQKLWHKTDKGWEQYV